MAQDSFCPTTARPETTGRLTFTGAALVTSPVGEEVTAGPLPIMFVAVSCASIV